MQNSLLVGFYDVMLSTLETDFHLHSPEKYLIKNDHPIQFSQIKIYYRSLKLNIGLDNVIIENKSLLCQENENNAIDALVLQLCL